MRADRSRSWVKSEEESGRDVGARKRAAAGGFQGGFGRTCNNIGVGFSGGREMESEKAFESAGSRMSNYINLFMWDLTSLTSLSPTVLLSRPSRARHGHVLYYILYVTITSRLLLPGPSLARKTTLGVCKMVMVETRIYPHSAFSGPPIYKPCHVTSITLVLLPLVDLLLSTLDWCRLWYLVSVPGPVAKAVGWGRRPAWVLQIFQP
jgi:hypothetical protein